MACRQLLSRPQAELSQRLSHRSEWQPCVWDLYFEGPRVCQE